jgi:hypothetical protein
MHAGKDRVKAAMLCGDHGPNLIQSNEAAAVLTQIDPENSDLH